MAMAVNHCKQSHLYAYILYMVGVQAHSLLTIYVMFFMPCVDGEAVAG